MNKKFWRTFVYVFLEALIVVFIILLFLWMKIIAFDAFSNTPYDKKDAKQITYFVKREQSIGEISKELEQKKIISNHLAMELRYYCSDYTNDSFQAGKHEISSDMGIDALLDEFTGR